MEFVDGRSLDELKGRAAGRRAAADPPADCRGARGGARQRHHPPRLEARQHQAPRRWHGQGARLRSGEGVRSRWRRTRRQRLADDDESGHRPRRDSGHGRLHESGAGARARRRSPRRHLGIWRRRIRARDGFARVWWRNRLRHDRRGAAAGRSLGSSAARRSAEIPAPAQALPRARSTQSLERRRRRPD